MDSIFEQPRITPKQTPIHQNFKATVVPEASLILQNTQTKDPKISGKVVPSIPPHLQSYNAWKLRNVPILDAQDSFVTSQSDKENGNKKNCQNYVDYQFAYNTSILKDNANSSILKKQVRFEKPSYQPSTTVVVKSPNFSALLRNPKEKIKHDSTKLSTKRRETKPDRQSPILDPNNPKPSNFENPIANKRVQTPYDKFYSQNTKLDLSLNEDISKKHFNEKRTSDKKNAEELFQKSTLNSENIQKFSTPEHILREERERLQNIRQILDETVPNRIIDDSKKSIQSEPLKQITLPLELPSQRILADLTNFENTSNQTGDKLSNTSCKCKCDAQKNEKKAKEVDSTVAELISIVKTQNEQLHILQNQVEMLIKINKNNDKNNELAEVLAKFVKISNESDKRSSQQRIQKRESKEEKRPNEMKNKTRRNNIERKPERNIALYKEDENLGTNYDKEVCQRITRENYVTKQMKNDKISVGIMTSFQVSLTSPYERPKYQRKPYESEASSSTTTERSSKRNHQNLDDKPIKNGHKYQSDDSQKYNRHTNHPVKVFTDTWHDKNNMIDKYLSDEATYSDESSGKDENDYSIDEIGLKESLEVQEPPLSPNNTVHVDMQDYESDSDDETSTADPGWTFYDNILGKVNNILENSPIPRDNQKRNKIDYTSEQIKEQAMRDLKDQTKVNPNEISFAFKQMLMKYMSDEELATIIQTKDDLRPRRENPPIQQGIQNHGAKILDITTLKKQPKLL